MIRTATPQDILAIAENMRDADKYEVEALTGLSPLEALSVGLFHSDHCVVGVGKDDELVGAWGCMSAGVLDVGCVWFLSTDAVTRNVREVIVEGRAWLDQWQGKYPVLTNYVTTENSVHIRLIKALGFEFGDPIHNYGTGGVSVLPFKRGTLCAHQQ